MCQGVWKSGSPIPSEITSLIFATISKKSRMPDLGRSATWRATKRWVSMVGGAAGPGDPGRLRAHLEPAGALRRRVEQIAALLVGTQHEMGAGREHSLDGRELFGHERRHLLQAGPRHEDQQVVSARHEVAGLDLVESAQALGQAVEAAPALRGDLHLDHGAHGGDVRQPGKVDHRAPAEEDPVLLQLLQALVNLRFGQARDLRQLRRCEVAAFDQELENRIHREDEVRAGRRQSRESWVNDGQQKTYGSRRRPIDLNALNSRDQRAD